jgi:uncharacterized membrane protein
MTERKVRTADVLGDAFDLAARHRLAASVSGAILFGVGMVIDLSLSPDLSAAMQFLLSFLTLYVQLLLVCIALRALDLLPPGADPRRPTLGRFPAAFVLAFISGLAIFAGLVLLVLPGLVLWARWFAALPALVAEDRRAGSALRRSWELTAGHPLPLVAIGAILMSLFAVQIGALIFAYPVFGLPPFWAAALFNLLGAVETVAGAFLGVGLYVRLAETPGMPEQPAPGPGA